MSVPAMVGKGEITQRVVQSILARQIRPGERLGEHELAQLFGVSRTLVREALMQLQARGFVAVRPRVGWYVVEPSFAEARETYAARRVIEPGMLRDAGRPLQSAVISRLRQHVAEERNAIAHRDAATRSVALADFHVCLAECLGNRFLTSVMVDLSARTTLVSALYQSQTEAQDSNDDHAAIVEALATGDHVRAEALMRAHIDTLAARLDESLAHSARAQDRLRSALAPDNATKAARHPGKGRKSAATST
ncbi:GntR family transcriptional regulator [Azohydromonas caseinilytica]|uniref:GntR family transcriptional regulator n=1 Tax=Azohydromonas caseinilytica TaxID=2728836 RepID=A0A848FAZ2_9BURK|nr:GntR family transcriptional regulator [Azohydromonas caseinilytica]NML16694.1 GntR family transcriptional regulator [Azohydromonas caseinilytica]